MFGMSPLNCIYAMKTHPILFSALLTAMLATKLSAQNITDDAHDDLNPQIVGDLIVWQSRIPDAISEPDDLEVMVKFGDEKRQITDNQGDDENIKIFGTTIVWQSWDGTDWEVWAYDASMDLILQLTENDTDDINPSIDGTNVVWQAWDGTDFEIATASVSSIIPNPVQVKITPRSLNLRSNGKWVAASIDLSETGFGPEDIDLATIFLEETIPAQNVKLKNNGLSMKFDRKALQALLSGAGEVELTITAKTLAGDVFVGSDTIRTIP